MATSTDTSEVCQDAFVMKDPRHSIERAVGVVAFYYPGRDTPVDQVCKAGFLSNFYDLSPDVLTLSAGIHGESHTHTFKNSESAFQALKFWSKADKFSLLSAEQAFQLKRSAGFKGREDFTYGGYGSNWAGMLAVLRTKFAPGSRMAKALLDTGEAFLLEHNEKAGRDNTWSDDNTGEGQNWLGMQLMLLRDELQLSAAFSSLGSDADGIIHTKDLHHVLQQLGQNPSTSQLQSAIEEMDVDGSGHIDFRVFSTAILFGNTVPMQSWTCFLRGSCGVDVETGPSRAVRNLQWQEAVRCAVRSLAQCG